MNFLCFILKSRQLVFGLVFTAILAATMIHAFWQPRVYQSSGTLLFNSSMPPEEPMLMLRMLEAPKFSKKVVKRLSDVERTDFLKPFDHAPMEANDSLIERLISKHRSVVYESGIVTLVYRHPDRLIASRIARLFLDEAIGTWARRRIDESMKGVEELKRRWETHNRKMQAATEEMAAYRETRRTSTGELFEPDTHYRALEQQAANERELTDSIIQRMRRLTSGGLETSSWRVHKKPVPANEDDYLLAPIVSRVAWGFVLAVLGGLLSVMMVRCIAGRRGTRPDLTNF